MAELVDTHESPTDKSPTDKSPTEKSSLKTMDVDNIKSTEAANRETASIDFAETNLINLNTSNIKRDLNVITLICFGFSLCSSWLALSLSSIIAIVQGGTATLLYGTVVVAVPYICTGLTLAELISVYPTAGGQYHFTSILAPKKWSKSLSYTSGTAALFSWLAMEASTYLITANIIFAVVIQLEPSYVPQRWHLFLLYEAVNILATLYNIYLIKRTSKIYDFAFILSAAGFFIISITCLARAETKQSSQAVWASFTNNTGWNDAVCFLTGIVTPGFAFGGLDSTMHLVEETKQPRKAVSKAICYTFGMGVVTAFLFTIATVYCIADIDTILSTPTGVPIYELWIQATRSVSAATVFMILIIVIDLIVCIATVNTTSRLTWALGRDNAFFGSKYLAEVHPKYEVPMWSLWANAVVVAVLGVLYMASTTAFNSFLGTSIQLLQFSFAIPSALLIYRRRSSIFLPHDRPFRLSHPFGYFCHIVAIIWTIVICTFWMFPASVPVTPSNMNYAVVVVAIGAIILAINWFVHAKKNFVGPVIEFQE